MYIYDHFSLNSSQNEKLFRQKLQRHPKHFYFSVSFSRKSRSLWHNFGKKKNGRVGQATDDILIRSMRFASWISKAKNTHSECVILINFPRQQWSHGRASMLRYTDIACLCRLVFTMTVFRTTCSAVCGKMSSFLMLQQIVLYALLLLGCEGLSGEEVNMLTTYGTRTAYEWMPMVLVPWTYEVNLMFFWPCIIV